MSAVHLAFGVCLASAVVACDATIAPAAIPPLPAERVPSDKWPADHLEFVGSNASASWLSKIPGAPGMSDTGRIAVNADPNDYFSDLSFSLLPRPSGDADANGARWEADLNYKLRRGKIVPMLGAVYSVEQISMNPLRVKLNRVTDANLLKQIDVSPGSTTIPLGRSARFSFRDKVPTEPDQCSVNVRSITGSGAPTAHLLLSHSEKPSGQSPTGPALATEIDSAVDIKAGNRVEIMPGRKVRVVRVVAPNNVRGVIGWVELDPKTTTKGAP